MDNKKPSFLELQAQRKRMMENMERLLAEARRDFTLVTKKDDSSAVEKVDESADAEAVAFSSSEEQHKMVVERKFKAVIFDMGGVIIKYKNPQLIVDLFNKAKTNPEALHALSEWDIGNISLQDMRPILAQLHDQASKEEIEGIINGIASNTKHYDDAVVAAVKQLRNAGFKTALLTNNGWIDHEHTQSVIINDLSDFDVVVESCKIKLRKPDASIYLRTTEQLGIEPEACIFIDDFPLNCDGANAVGMTSILLSGGDSAEALKKLTELTGVAFN